METTELSIIIVSHNVRSLLVACIASLRSTVNEIDCEIIVVDNASSDDTVDEVRRLYPEVKLLANTENVGFARANNQGYQLSTGQFVLLLNPDTIVKPNAIESTLNFLKGTPEAGMAGCRLLNADGSLQKSIRRFPSITDNLMRMVFLDRFFYRECRRKTYYGREPCSIDYCTGAFMLIRRAAITEEYLLNPEFFMYSEEKDLALRLRKGGWLTYFVPYGEVVHFGAQSAAQIPTATFLELQKSQVIFYGRHFSPVRALGLSLTWFAVLFSTLVLSAPFLFIKKGRERSKLFAHAVFAYPSILKNSSKIKYGSQ